MSCLTAHVPKALMPVVDVCLIDRLIAVLHASDVQHVVIGVGWKGQMIEEHIRESYPDSEVRVVHVHDWNSGPLTTLVRALEAAPVEQFLSCPADCVVEPELVIGTLQAHGSAQDCRIATLAVHPSMNGGTRVYSRAPNEIASIDGQPDSCHDVGRSAMILVAHPSFVEHCREALSVGCSRVTDALNMALAKGARIGYHPFECPLFDIDDFSDLLAANRHLIMRGCRSVNRGLCVPSGTHVDAGGVGAEEYDIHLASGASIIGPSYVGPGSKMGHGAVVGPLAILGPSSSVGERTIVRDTVAFGGAVFLSDKIYESTVVYGDQTCGRDEH
ncbi:MAG: NDP-sugar synthase [Candidatus Thorarchaeota archaeon]